MTCEFSRKNVTPIQKEKQNKQKLILNNVLKYQFSFILKSLFVSSYTHYG